MIRRIAIAVVLSAMLVHATHARASGEGAATFYNQGNAAFLAGAYTEAIDAYEKARAQGSDDARLLYNLGCAHMKAGNLGQAIRFFEMARLRDPRDADIIHNLGFAKSSRADALPETDESLVMRLGRFGVERLRFAELAGAAAVCYVLGFAVIGAGWPRRRDRAGRRVIAAGVALFLLAFVAGAYAIEHRREYGGARAVVAPAELAVKSGPSMDNPTLFTVHAGMDCKVRETRGTWSLIEIPTGFTGWAPNEALLPIG